MPFHLFILVWNQTLSSLSTIPIRCHFRFQFPRGFKFPTSLLVPYHCVLTPALQHTLCAYLAFCTHNQRLGTVCSALVSMTQPSGPGGIPSRSIAWQALLAGQLTMHAPKLVVQTLKPMVAMDRTPFLFKIQGMLVAIFSHLLSFKTISRPPYQLSPLTVNSEQLRPSWIGYNMEHLLKALQ